jgi:tryptophan-rich sensory protein
MTAVLIVSPWRHAAVLAGCIVASFAPGVFGARFQPGDWYAQLAKSPLTPPGWVFPIAWTALYITIGVALYVMLNHTSGRERWIPLAAFVIQLVLNGAWSWLFFGCHAVTAALIEIGVLWISIVAMGLAFARHSRFAGQLLVPYLAWVSFATYLNFEIWRANT